MATLTPNANALLGFRSQIDAVFNIFGGLEQIQYFLPEEQIIDIALFNGPSFCTTPYQFEYTPGQFLPYYLFSLELLGYQEGIPYSVFDASWRHIYTDKAGSINYKNERRYFWGLNPKEQELVQNSYHGQRYFIQFQTSTNLVLAQMLVCQTFKLELINSFITDLELNIKTKQTYSFNEVYLNFPQPQPYPVRIWTLESPFDSVSSVKSLKENKNTVITDYPVGSVAGFANPNSSLWILAEYLINNSANIPLNLDQITGIDSWQTKTLYDPLAGTTILFINAGPVNRSAPMNRLIGGLGTPIKSNFLSSNRVKVNIIYKQSNARPEDVNITASLSDPSSLLLRVF